MRKEPLVSIVIPVYNSSHFLHRCINSVLLQDYSNIEIILIDDGSTDDSPEICDEFASQNKNISVYHIPNSGASFARKKGIEVASGQLISFVDSDDYVAINYISAMYKAMEKYDTLLSSCDVQILVGEKRLKNDYKANVCLLSEYDLMSRFFNYEFWGLPGSLYKIESFYGIEFPKPTLSEDYFIKAQMFLRNCKMAYVSSPLYMYEKHDGSLSNTTLSVRAFEEFENVFQVYNMTLEKNTQYQSLALKNVTETCIKLLLKGTIQERLNFKDEYKPIQNFLRVHCSEILRNVFLLNKLKFIAVSLRYFPFLSRVYNYILK